MGKADTAWTHLKKNHPIGGNDMNLIPLLSTVILIATIVTIVIAVGSYLAFKIRESRTPDSLEVSEEKEFFVPYVPEVKR
jgi:heme/copper-type cytochrome/quinol oxidase subunit 2